MEACIICQRHQNDPSVEHIVPRSMGNLHYVLPKGWVCSVCNNRFAKFENVTLNRPDIYAERLQYSVVRSPRSEDPRRLISKDEDKALIVFLIKIAFESLMFSKPKVMSNDEKIVLRKVLLLQCEHDYPPLESKHLLSSVSIPGFIDRFRLRRNGIALSYQRNGDELWFHFRYGRLNYVIRLS